MGSDLDWLQVFGLIRDPMEDNNWKMKHTEARLLERERVSEQPRLENCSLQALAFS